MNQQRSGSDVTGRETAGQAAHLLVVIDHREARVYRTEVHGSVPQRITPYDPGGSGRHLHYVQDDSNGQRRPDRRSFYEDIAKALRGAEQILVFGGGTGASSAMEELLTQLRHHHGDVAQRVVKSMVLDETHLSEDQLLAKARDCYASLASRESVHSPAAKTGVGP